MPPCTAMGVPNVQTRDSTSTGASGEAQLTWDMMDQLLGTVEHGPSPTSSMVVRDVPGLSTTPAFTPRSLICAKKQQQGEHQDHARQHRYHQPLWASTVHPIIRSCAPEAVHMHSMPLNHSMPPTPGTPVKTMPQPALIPALMRLTLCCLMTCKYEYSCAAAFSECLLHIDMLPMPG